MEDAMNPEVKDLWISALESGQYDQGSGALHVDDKFCCLGVLCDLANRAGILSTFSIHRDDGPMIYTYDGIPSILPESVVGWAGLGSRDPNIRINGEPQSLT